MCGEIKNIYRNQLLIINNDDVYDSLINYNPVHLNNANFENLHLLNELESYMRIQRNEDLFYCIGILFSIYSIYKFICEIIKSIANK